ncbi:aspartyl protease family protein [Yersinia aldovae]|uniref:Predicted aspartyl protease n=1 Tax=Yersinia aldovae TaxID=29483 RepID=A0ABM9SX56_YERAL|nr:aspartyl protease family protein [Yersinia aldovae]CNL56652.1 Predicted aspartyl protease [Yersinia aldovae]
MYFLLNKCFIAFGLLSTAIVFIVPCNAQQKQPITSEAVMHMPFKLDSASVPMTTVEINGQRQTFMIDTGASFALYLFKDVMTQLSGLVLNTGKQRTTDLTGKVFLNDKFQIPRLSINGMIFEDIKGMSISSPRGMPLTPDSNLPNTMMIGLGLFKEKAVLIDYKNQRLSVADNTQALGINMTDGWISLPLQVTQEGITVNVSQNSKEYNMVLDTGASVSVFWKERLKSPAIDISCRAVMAEMDHEGCVSSEFRLNGIGPKDIKLNAVLLDGTFQQMDTDGLIGKNFLDRFTVLIDFPGQRLLIKKV